MSARSRLAESLHRFADRFDASTARRVTHWSFTFERGEGVRFREDGRGCPVAYLSSSDYDRAHQEAAQ